MRKAGFLVVLSLLLVAPTRVGAQDPNGNNQVLQCQHIDGSVVLEWDIVFVAPILGWIVGKDGGDLIELPPDASNFLDSDVFPGNHEYSLQAINFTGNILDLRRCVIDVPYREVRCDVEDNKVDIKWGPILIDIAILNFRISRNGVTVATPNANDRSYTDTAPDIGTYDYCVYAVTSPNSEFLLGCCSVEVTCFGIKSEVNNLEVKLGWDSPILAPGPSTFIVTRDNQLVVETQEMEFTDTVPAPGVYLYEVTQQVGPPGGLGPVYLIGRCFVKVPVLPIPPPEDLTCRVLFADIVPIPLDPTLLTAAEGIDSNGDGIVDSSLPQAAVLLKWVNPMLYDRIVILRNKAIAATLPGTATRYVDRVHGSGLFEYDVYGLIGNQRSAPAECTVDVPPPFVPPPQEFRCVLLDIALDPNDPDNPLGEAAPGDDSVIATPFPVVLLTWWNPVRYSRIVISRDGAEIARLEGDAMRYRDIAPPAGEHVYGIYGIVEDGRQSVTVECRIDAGGPVPAVFDLRCVVTQPAAGFPTGSVHLAWENAAVYDRILVLRNDVIIFTGAGDLTEYRDLDLAAGVYDYCIVALQGNRRSRSTCCQVVIVGVPPKNLLYFTPTFDFLPADPTGVTLEDLSAFPPDILPQLPGNRVTSLADNVAPIQGWSFGVGNDPAFIAPASADIDWTDTQALNNGNGPGFLYIDILSDGSGVVMAVIVAGNGGPSETLPAGQHHRLLNIEYQAGPSGAPGETYPIRYTGSLDSPPVQVLFVVDGFEVNICTRPGRVSVPGPRFLRSDSNVDGTVDISDAMFTLLYLFINGEEPGCIEAANANGSRALNIADPIHTFQFLFNGGGAPPHPFPFCRFAPAPLSCIDPGVCLTPLPADES
jgi:hypothetical protein